LFRSHGGFGAHGPPRYGARLRARMRFLVFAPRRLHDRTERHRGRWAGAIPALRSRYSCVVAGRAPPKPVSAGMGARPISSAAANSTGASWLCMSCLLIILVGSGIVNVPSV